MLGATTTVTILRHTAGSRDSEGRKTSTFTPGETVTGNLFEQASRELVGTVWTTVQLWKALLPAGTNVTHRDALETADGRRYRIETVTPRRGPSGNVHHLSCQLRAVEGTL
jgi:hypothetical protein